MDSKHGKNSVWAFYLKISVFGGNASRFWALNAKWRGIAPVARVKLSLKLKP
ncbi:hypothetical protein NHP190003_10380 [Helicobacter sp. NHP19-003]|uniref:Uncharacterized protein n=1 Tax=Helicobacter gastrocanis TaxID=2849641 RepID=A0ABM7SCN6_9HELI|nr:hypothetical protein [Helicobacter sp. NHP19-003]BCZ17756.1 hypothetical protein NHP190003_10380 [Helicobacter sp. NHP19-003]